MAWEKTTLGDVCHIEKGNIGILKAIQGDYPLVVLGEERRTHNEYQFDGDAVVIPLVSSTGHGDRSMKRIHFQSGKFSVGSILCAVIPKDSSALSAEFLYRYLDLNKEQKLVSRMKGMANVSLSIKSIAEVEIPLPPIQMQKEIINSFKYLETQTNALSSDQTLQLDLLKKLRQQILQDAIQGKLVTQDPNDEPANKLLESIKAEKEKLLKGKKIKKGKALPEIKADEIPFEIPENWIWCRLGDIVLSMTNGIYKEDKFYNEGGIGCLRMYNIKDGRINFNNLKRMILTDKELLAYALEENDLLLNRVNSIELLGKAGLIKKLAQPLVFESKNIRVRLFKKETLAGYINYVFQLPFIKNQIYHSFKKVTGQASISQEKLNPLLIPLPPANEQLSIVSKIEKLMMLCNELEQSIQQNQKYTQELLQVALKEALEQEPTEIFKV